MLGSVVRVHRRHLLRFCMLSVARSFVRSSFVRSCVCYLSTFFVVVFVLIFPFSFAFFTFFFSFVLKKKMRARASVNAKQCVLRAACFCCCWQVERGVLTPNWKKKKKKRCTVHSVMGAYLIEQTKGTKEMNNKGSPLPTPTPPALELALRDTSEIDVALSSSSSSDNCVRR